MVTLVARIIKDKDFFCSLDTTSHSAKIKINTTRPSEACDYGAEYATPRHAQQTPLDITFGYAETCQTTQNYCCQTT